MKVLIFNTFVEGTSTAKIATGLYRKLKENGNECIILYGAGETNGNPDFYRVSNEADIKMQWVANQLTGIHGSFAPFAFNRTKKIIEEFQPDIIQLFNMHYYYMDIYGLFSYLKKNNYPIVYSMLDEYPYLGYCCYAYDCNQFQTGCLKCDYKRFKYEYPRSLFFNGAAKTIKLKEKAYSNYNKLVFTGPKWVIERAESSYLLKNKELVEIDEFIDTEKIFFPRNTEELRKKHNLEQKTVILNVAPSKDERKGVKYYVEMAKRIDRKDVVFIHVGYQDEPHDLPDNFIPIPFVKDQNLLAQYYSLADLFVCTSLADTMPNVCLDALACGTPVAGFNITGVPYVAEKPLGRFVNPRDVDALINIVMEIMPKDQRLIDECREYALSRYSPQTFYEKLNLVYRKMLEE